MKKPLASCVCVTYNRPKLINEILYCFLAQDYENKELIILNDQEKIKYSYNDSRVRIFNLSERFPSLGTKRNYTRRLVKGDYVFIMDDDDIYYSNHISRLIEFHQKNPTYDIVGNGMCHFSQDNRDIQNQPDPLAFNGACIKTNYYLTHEFPDNKSSGEDFDYIQAAKVKKTNDGETSWHYRWGLDIWHISGMGGDGMESYNKLTRDTKPILIEPFVEVFKEKNTLRKIELQPQISNDVKKYYR